jgi:DNA polymerase-1
MLINPNDILIFLGLRTLSKPTLFLIDGSSQMYRAYHAIRGLTGPDGRSTNAVYGFTTMLRKLITDQRPALIAAAFDLAGPTFRSELSADYKANRAPMPPDLAEQVPIVRRACEALGVPVLTHAGFEADDVIGTIAVKAAERDYAVAIVTGDKDFFQLVCDGIRVFNPRDEGTWYDEAGVKDKFGVAPNQVVDVLTLMGDSIDNVRGVPGIGEKGAKDLIATHGTLDRLIEASSSLSQKKYREALATHGENARQSRELLRIRTDVPVAFEIESFRYRGAYREQCFELFSQMGFRTLVAEYAPTADTIAKDYVVVESLEALAELAAELRKTGRFAYRAITDGNGGMSAALIGLAFATAVRRARYVPLAHTGLGPVQNLNPRDALAILKPIFEDATIAKIGHDLKFDAVVLARHAITVAGYEFDTMLASYLLDATRSEHPLEETALEYLTYKAIKEEELRGKGIRARSIADVPPDLAVTYAGERADLPWQLAEQFAPMLETSDLDKLFREIEMPLVPVLCDVEREGVRIDGASLAKQSQHIERELSSLGVQIFDLAGQEFNINSPKQLSEVLFEKLKLPTLKRTGKTRAASTAVEVLDELALSHDLPRLILEWRALSKLKSTYIDALPQLTNPSTGRVHTCFNQAVAATGRLSSSDPNLQNIPIRTDLGRQIRAAFVADPGNVLISADYSQIELRVLAHLAGDEILIEAFRHSEDIHDRTAMQVFGSNSGLDKHELRRRAKIVNYALLYGKTAFTLARDIGVTQQAAQQFIDAYFAGFPRVRAFIEETLDRGRQTGLVQTMFGRRRLVPELTSRNGQIRSAAERVAVNMPIQGTAADILKRAMIAVHNRLKQYPGAGSAHPRMILTVHDELLFETPKALAAEVAADVRSIMEGAAELAVPLTVDIGIGENWREAKG